MIPFLLFFFFSFPFGVWQEVVLPCLLACLLTDGNGKLEGYIRSVLWTADLQCVIVRYKGRSGLAAKSESYVRPTNLHSQVTPKTAQPSPAAEPIGALTPPPFPGTSLLTVSAKQENCVSAAFNHLSPSG